MSGGLVQFINESIDIVNYNRLGGKADDETASLEWAKAAASFDGLRFGRVRACL